MSNSSDLSRRSDLERVMDAARTPGWSLGLDRQGRIMATRDSGRIGLPWVVRCDRAGRGLRVSQFRPDDDATGEGEVIGEIVGGPREMGRQLRDVLGALDVTEGPVT